MRLSWSGCCIVVVALLQPACARHVRRTLEPPQAATTLDRRSAFLKIHLRDGRLYVLQEWAVDGAARTVSGTGHLYGADRAALDSLTARSYVVSLDSVALFETNVVTSSPSVPAFAALTVITGAVAIACLTNPKACFGSCPTFYGATPDGDQLLAEGFSASVAPALEATDVDALAPLEPGGRTLALRMRNEAWETHVVRYVRVLAAPRTPGGRVFTTTDGEFVQTDRPAAPARCAAAEGDCRAALSQRDRQERTSAADSTDLATRETIDLEFDPPPGDGALGLVLAYRQTLLTTYLFYQGLAWMGDRAGEWLAALDRTPGLRGTAGSVAGALGRIDVLVPGDTGWTAVGRAGETGPLATDVKLVPLPRPTAGPVRVRLRLTRGLWRLDQAALVRLGARVTPTRLAPARARATRHDAPELRRWIADSASALVTLPGDDVDLEFDVPGDPGQVELFLEARGYYLEWMRQEWLAEAQPLLAARLYLDPASALRALAPEFSRREPELERTFWSSRYARR